MPMNKKSTNNEKKPQITPNEKATIDAAVKKTVHNYRKTLQMLAKT